MFGTRWLALILAVALAAGSRADTTAFRHPAFGEHAAEREAMVREQLTEIRDQRVLAAMRRVPRHAFVPEALHPLAYGDGPLPIGHDQTISQPLVVAHMTEVLDVQPGQRVLELGTGSGYQAAVLAELGAEVYTMEIVPELAERAAAVLKELCYDRVHVRAGDGYFGWPEHAPFDRIIVTFGAEDVPPPLISQLAGGGIMVMPVGASGLQWLTVLRKDEAGVVTHERTWPVRFVPMTGEHAHNPSAQDNSPLSEGEIMLPQPALVGNLTLEEVLAERRSVRAFTPDSLTLSELSQLLWAAQGITSDEGYRTSPSAGATYPLEVYAIVKRVAGLAPGIYHYVTGPAPHEHHLEAVTVGDPTPSLSLAAGQTCVAECAAAIAIAAVESRTAARYGSRAARYGHMEAGHAAQNALLQAQALGLGAVPVGAFDDYDLKNLLRTPGDALYLIPVGRPRP
jgi:protein-L-isoaspartate(D-aspartate) O-methyltransferase